MPVKGSVAPMVIWCAVTPGTFAVAAPALTMELPAVTRPRHSNSAVPEIVTRRDMVVTILIISPDVELLGRERRRPRLRFQVTLGSRAKSVPQMSRGAAESERGEEHREDQQAPENDAVKLAREVTLRVESRLGRDPRDDVGREGVDDAADEGSRDRADAADDDQRQNRHR